MSTLFVNKLKAAVGSIINVPADQTLYAPGHVIQVINGSHSTTVASTVTSFADTGLTATITPTNNTSKILVLVNQQGCQKYGANTGLQLKLFRGSTELTKFESQLGINANIQSQAARAAKPFTSSTAFVSQEQLRALKKGETLIPPSRV